MDAERGMRETQCPVCGNHLNLCCASAVLTALEPQRPSTTTATTIKGTASTTAANNDGPVAEKKASKARTSKRFTYEDPEFLVFWEAYPLKRGKAAAYRKWQQAIDAGVPSTTIITAATDYRNDPLRDPQYTKWPEGWLAAGRWDDVAAVVRPAAPKTDPAQIKGTPEWDARIAAEEERAIGEVSA